MDIQKKKNIYMIVGGIIIAVVFFYGGMQYGGNNVKNAQLASRAQGGGNGGMRGNRGGVGGFVSGNVISSDGKSLTIGLRAGGSQIVFLSDSTTVLKSVSGAPTDLASGQQVVITGTPNSDGSLTATSVQIRPAMQTPVVNPTQGK